MLHFCTLSKEYPAFKMAIFVVKWYLFGTILSLFCKNKIKKNCIFYNLTQLWMQLWVWSKMRVSSVHCRHPEKSPSFWCVGKSELLFMVKVRTYWSWITQRFRLSDVVVWVSWNWIYPYCIIYMQLVLTWYRVSSHFIMTHM